MALFLKEWSFTFFLVDNFHKVIHIQLLDGMCSQDRIEIFISATLFRV
jgi:hypothetical protein